MNDSRLIRSAITQAADAALRMLWPACRRSARCLFVLSTGRAGTDTLTHMLGLSPAIRAEHQPEPQFPCELKTVYGQVWSDPDAYARVFSRVRSVLITRTHLAGKLYAETSARMTFFAPAIAGLLPQSKFIHLHRHPAAVVRSGMRRGWYQNHPNDKNRLVPPETDPAASKWNEWSPFAKICWRWDAYNRFALRMRTSLPPERVLSVRSEDLFRAGEDTAHRIFDFLGLPRPSGDEILQVVNKKHNSQEQGHYPFPREWDVATRNTLDQIAGETMKALGYSWADFD